MKRLLSLSLFILPAALLWAEPKAYDVRPIERLPDGAIAWELNNVLSDHREGRFQPYNAEAAAHLILDATAERGVAGEENVPARGTFFRAAYDERGVGILIEAEEPLIQELQESLIDPASPAKNEALELFFTPAVDGAAYYQIFIRPATGQVEFYDWGSAHRHYRSLKGMATVESRFGKEGFLVALFIPWEAIYEHLPVQGGEWRFSLVRWMPFAKAGGVTWGGKVHETGQFGRLKFAKPNDALRLKMEQRLARSAWLNFQAQSQVATRTWNDGSMGDPTFFTERLLPIIQEYRTKGDSLGPSENWGKNELVQVEPLLKEWLEFPYKVEELRTDYLVEKRLIEADASIPSKSTQP